MSKVTNYNEVSKTYDTGRQASDAHVIKSLMEHFTGKKVQDLDIIDIGSGTGNYSEYFLSFAPRSLTLIDASEGMLNRAKEKLTSESAGTTQLSFRQVILPDMPFPDNSFDAGMINLVLHHLEVNPDGKSFPNVFKTMQETYRILRPGGVLTIITETPETIDGTWFGQLVPETRKRWHKRFPNHFQMSTMLKEAGFSIKSALKSLVASYLPVYGDLEGPLHESWRNLNSFWALCTDSEIQDMVKNVNEMKSEGTLQSFFEKHDKVYKVGACEIFAVKKEDK